MVHNLLFEIGVEEIPARFMESAIKQLNEGITSLFAEHRLEYSTIEVYGTPRRIVALVKGLDSRQKDLKEEVKGPSTKAAYDGEGNPTKALEGFLKGQGTTKEQIYTKVIGNSEYVHFTKLIVGKKTSEVLKELLPKTIGMINFPRSMKWGGKNLKFIRPIRWLVTLLDDKTVEFEVEGIKSSNISMGHRFLGNQQIIVDSANRYMDLLKENFVIVNQNERKEIIINQTKALASKLGGKVIDDKDLLEEVIYLVEYPTALHGNFDKEFLQLPMEVVTTPMKEHQRYFPVVDDKEKLLPYFITVRNGNELHKEIVSLGNEKVLRARLEDARFFYNEDLKKPLEQYVERLKTVVFQESLGTIYEKNERTQKIGEHISNLLKLDKEILESIKRCVYLSKADTVTNMVYEFTELQGIMGKDYAIKSGEKLEVAEGIFEHHLPRFAEDILPSTTVGRIVSIADKLDTICGCFGIGIQPTGSQDPYGLRRQALGIVNIIIDSNYSLSLRDLISSALEVLAQSGRLKEDKEKTTELILEFFMQRLKNVMQDMNIRYDVIDSMLSSKVYDAVKITSMAKTYNNWIANKDIFEAMNAFNRVNNLASKTQNTDIDVALFENSAEKELFGSYIKYKESILNKEMSKDYEGIIQVLTQLIEPINKFFDGTMVMVENEAIRNNRLALLKNIANLINFFGDISKIVYK